MDEELSGWLGESGVVVIGGGVAGLGVAWRLATAGVRVAVLERDAPGAGATSAAAGMLAPLAEVDFTEDRFIDLKRESLRRWPAFAAALEAASGVGVEYRDEGTLLVAIDRDDAEALRRHYEHLRGLELPVAWLTGDEARAMEPLLAPAIPAAVSVPSDHQVDPLRVVEALVAACARAGAVVRCGVEVEGIEAAGGAVTGVRLRGGAVVACRRVVVAAGCWVRALTGLPGRLARSIRPVKGQMLALDMRAAPGARLERVVRAPDCYLIPRRDGRLIVGATSEERGFDVQLTAGGLFELLRGAYETLPITWELPVLRTWAGLRPAALDNEPVLGHTSMQGLVMAAGLYRNGILLAPIVADLIAQAVQTGRDDALAQPFLPGRLE